MNLHMLLDGDYDDVLEHLQNTRGGIYESGSEVDKRIKAKHLRQTSGSDEKTSTEISAMTGPTCDPNYNFDL